MTHTPGKWNWWTSNSWRRLRSDLGHGKTGDVLQPYVCRDGQPDIQVTEADMALIAAAPDMLAALKDTSCPAGGWTGIKPDMDPTVENCMKHSGCGCIYGEIVRKAEGR